MHAADTNLLVRLLTRDEPSQFAAAKRFVGKGAWVSTVVVAEVVWVLRVVYQCPPEQLQAALELMLKHEHLVLQDADAVALALEQFRKRPALGFSDCLVLELARKAGHLPLGTFDKKLSKLEGTVKA